MSGNYLGNVTFVFSWCDISAYQHNEISFVYLKKRYFDSIEIYDKQGKVILASLYSGKFDTRNDPLVFAGTEWYFYFHTQFLHAKGPLKETCEIKVPMIMHEVLLLTFDINHSTKIRQLLIWMNIYSCFSMMPTAMLV